VSFCLELTARAGVRNATLVLLHTSNFRAGAGELIRILAARGTQELNFNGRNIA
jgi:hypothetical protein